VSNPADSPAHAAALATRPTSTSQPVVRDRFTGALVPVAGPIKHGRFRDYLARIIGNHGERAYDGILAIAEGRASFQKLVRNPQAHESAHDVALIPTVTVQPTIKERYEAYKFLAESLNGSPTKSIDVHTSTSQSGPVEPSYDDFEDSELEQLEAQLRRAAHAAARRAASEAEVVEEG
jgi:hypothetical protein